MIAAALVCSGAPIAFAQSTETVDTPSGKLDFKLGVPTKEVKVTERLQKHTRPGQSDTSNPR